MISWLINLSAKNKYNLLSGPVHHCLFVCLFKIQWYLSNKGFPRLASCIWWRCLGTTFSSRRWKLKMHSTCLIRIGLGENRKKYFPSPSLEMGWAAPGIVWHIFTSFDCFNFLRTLWTWSSPPTLTTETKKCEN